MNAKMSVLCLYNFDIFHEVELAGISQSFRLEIVR